MNHITKEGVVMNIAEMEDTHLVNTISMIIRTLGQAKNVIETPKTKAFESVLYDEKLDTKKAERIIKSHEIKLGVYILEANVRTLDITVPMKEYREIIGRFAMRPTSSVNLFLDHPNTAMKRDKNQVEDAVSRIIENEDGYIGNLW
jgi:hypothetical protein